MKRSLGRINDEFSGDFQKMTMRTGIYCMNVRKCKSMNTLQLI